MKILVLTLITNGPDPDTGRTPTPNARLHRVVDNAVLAEEEVAPALRTAVPSRPLAGAVPRDRDDARPADEPVGAVS
jgi:hypothetical protein